MTYPQMWLSAALGLAFGLVGIMRLCTTMTAIHWLKKHGASYKERLEEVGLDNLDGRAIRVALDCSEGGRVWPWGVLEYRLLDRGPISKFFARIVYRLVTLAPIALVSFVVLHRRSDPQWLLHEWAAVAIVYQIGVLLTAFEGLYAYVAVGSYRRHYHVGIRLSDDTKVSRYNELHELGILYPLFGAAFVVNIFSFTTSAIGWNAFSSKIPMDGSVFPTLWQGVYFVTTTFSTVGYGDITPQNFAGQLVAVLMELQGLLLIVGTFSSLLSFGLKRGR